MGPAVAGQKERVRQFWDSRPCGAGLARSRPGTPEFFTEVEHRRYELEPFIDRYAGFEQAAGKELLELGVGLGTDLVRFARAGARVTGLDLTPRSVELVRRRLELESLPGTVEVGDVERLPFPDGRFDVVYSWGVLHHTPDTPRAAREATRVLRPGGRLCVMVYARHSWASYGLWVRHGLLAGRPWRSLRWVMAHHLESEGTKGYRVAELEAMFAGLGDLRIERVAAPVDHRVAGPLARLTSSRLGLYVVVTGNAPG
jgi:SAM-dependent methyltransferase